MSLSKRGFISPNNVLNPLSYGLFVTFQPLGHLAKQGFPLCAVPAGGEVRLNADSTYSMVFVLQGSLNLTFSTHEQYSLQTSSLVVMDYQSLTRCICTPNTVLLMYTPPKRLSHFLKHSKAAFSTACSSPIPILSQLETWIENLLSNQLEDMSNSQSLCLTRRRQLARILLSYPHKQLEELFIPFHACASGDCAECQAEMTAEK